MASKTEAKHWVLAQEVHGHEEENLPCHQQHNTTQFQIAFKNLKHDYGVRQYQLKKLMVW
jgi:hypothetical protein